MISISDIFKIGLGPSSSHTVGPMKAATAFITYLNQQQLLIKVDNIIVEVYGSLALTGLGHGTFDAINLGLEGYQPDTISMTTKQDRLHAIKESGQIKLINSQWIHFSTSQNIIIKLDEYLPKHPNGMIFAAYDKDKQLIWKETYYSIGGGFITTAANFGKQNEVNVKLPFPFTNATELFNLCKINKITLSQLMIQNEIALTGENLIQIHQRIHHIIEVMMTCIKNGLSHDGTLPGGLEVQRRAPHLARKLKHLRKAKQINTQLWPMVYAMAVNEENAAGGKVVTAPTNGSAGIIPAVLSYYKHFHPRYTPEGAINFILTAGAIAILYKINASISGADVGCQGEVGVACSMAAAAYTAVSGGSLRQIENAAEMAMEHHLGLTCDPVSGLVQIPCIERNGIAAEKAIKLAGLALLEEGNHQKVSLDVVIQTMLATGKDMKSTYKETSLAGLATSVKRKTIDVSVRIVEC